MHSNYLRDVVYGQTFTILLWCQKDAIKRSSIKDWLNRIPSIHCFLDVEMDYTHAQELTNFVCIKENSIFQL